MNHTQEPWWACCTGEGGYSHYIFDRNERAICSLCSNDPDDKRDKYSSNEEILTVSERQANAERIVACVNFCEGVETEKLNELTLKGETTMDYPFMYSDPTYEGSHTLSYSSGQGEEVVTMTMKSGSHWGDLVDFFLRYLKASGYEVKGEDVRDYLLDFYPEEEKEEEPD